MKTPEELVAELDALIGPWAAPAPEPPAATAPAAVMAPPQPRPEPTAKPRILVVEDNKDYREVVQYLLQETGYAVFTAADGAQGVVEALRCRPDLVLLDFEMPELNGYEVLQELRRHDETRKLPIIMFTGAPNRQHLKSMGLDLCDFLEKPVSNAKLLGSINRAVTTGGKPATPAPGKPPEAKAAPPEPTPEDAAEIYLPPQGPTPTPSPAETPSIEFKLPEGLPNLEDLDNRPAVEEAEEPLLDVESGDEKHEEVVGLEASANDSPLIQKVNRILVQAVEMGASDIHIEPQEAQIIVRVRHNGSLQTLTTLPRSLEARLSARIKIMSDLVITERRLPQDGQFRATISGKKIEFRVSTLPSAYGEKVVIRVLGASKLKSNIHEAGLSPRDLEVTQRALGAPNGLILVTGPTGSGKTTTLYTMIAAVNKPDVNVLTAEDPIEYRLPGITQVHIRSTIGLTFEAALRSFLRQDPDIMLIGEIRDKETAEMAVKASITGHLVLSTLHTNSAPATVTRLLHMGVAPFLLAASVRLIVAQRLVKKICQKCKVPGELSADDRKLLSEADAARVKTQTLGVGCPDCKQTGFSGRLPIFEVMPLNTPEMRQLILAEADADRIGKQAVAEGMITLREAALRAVESADTSLAEALKIMLAE